MVTLTAVEISLLKRDLIQIAGALNLAKAVIAQNGAINCAIAANGPTIGDVIFKAQQTIKNVDKMFT